eukprot:gnl/Chilomastix_cuspidata/2056.p1 GENE.gnl/Chilomastix_cuspidata/2056~~gnl/Chilomastix_cuspidata/2056.p1  ORF type:complete len:1890 (-),score=534.86 gnl/Chilomastix_cuspidata/2056:642-6008(-)
MDSSLAEVASEGEHVLKQVRPIFNQAADARAEAKRAVISANSAVELFEQSRHATQQWREAYATKVNEIAALTDASSRATAAEMDKLRADVTEKRSELTSELQALQQETSALEKDSSIRIEAIEKECRALRAELTSTSDRAFEHIEEAEARIGAAAREEREAAASTLKTLQLAFAENVETTSGLLTTLSGNVTRLKTWTKEQFDAERSLAAAEVSEASKTTKQLFKKKLARYKSVSANVHEELRTRIAEIEAGARDARDAIGAFETFIEEIQTKIVEVVQDSQILSDRVAQLEEKEEAHDALIDDLKSSLRDLLREEIDAVRAEVLRELAPLKEQLAVISEETAAISRRQTESHAQLRDDAADLRRQVEQVGMTTEKALTIASEDERVEMEALRARVETRLTSIESRMQVSEQLPEQTAIKLAKLENDFQEMRTLPHAPTHSSETNSADLPPPPVPCEPSGETHRRLNAFSARLNAQEEKVSEATAEIHQVAQTVRQLQPYVQQEIERFAHSQRSDTSLLLAKSLESFRATLKNDAQLTQRRVDSLDTTLKRNDKILLDVRRDHQELRDDFSRSMSEHTERLSGVGADLEALRDRTRHDAEVLRKGLMDALQENLDSTAARLNEVSAAAQDTQTSVLGQVLAHTSELSDVRRTQETLLQKTSANEKAQRAATEQQAAALGQLGEVRTLAEGCRKDLEALRSQTLQTEARLEEKTTKDLETFKAFTESKFESVDQAFSRAEEALQANTGQSEALASQLRDVEDKAFSEQNELRKAFDSRVTLLNERMTARASETHSALEEQKTQIDANAYTIASLKGSQDAQQAQSLSKAAALESKISELSQAAAGLSEWRTQFEASTRAQFGNTRELIDSASSRVADAKAQLSAQLEGRIADLQIRISEEFSSVKSSSDSLTSEALRRVEALEEATRGVQHLSESVSKSLRKQEEGLRKHGEALERIQAVADAQETATRTLRTDLETCLRNLATEGEKHTQLAQTAASTTDALHTLSDRVSANLEQLQAHSEGIKAFSTIESTVRSQVEMLIASNTQLRAAAAADTGRLRDDVEAKIVSVKEGLRQLDVARLPAIVQKLETLGLTSSHLEQELRRIAHDNGKQIATNQEQLEKRIAQLSVETSRTLLEQRGALEAQKDELGHFKDDILIHMKRFNDAFAQSLEPLVSRARAQTSELREELEALKLSTKQQEEAVSQKISELFSQLEENSEQQKRAAKALTERLEALAKTQDSHLGLHNKDVLELRALMETFAAAQQSFKDRFGHVESQLNTLDSALTNQASSHAEKICRMIDSLSRISANFTSEVDGVRGACEELAVRFQTEVDSAVLEVNQRGISEREKLKEFLNDEFGAKLTAAKNATLLEIEDLREKFTKLFVDSESIRTDVQNDLDASVSQLHAEFRSAVDAWSGYQAEFDKNFETLQRLLRERDEVNLVGVCEEATHNSAQLKELQAKVQEVSLCQETEYERIMCACKDQIGEVEESLSTSLQVGISSSKSALSALEAKLLSDTALLAQSVRGASENAAHFEQSTNKRIKNLGTKAASQVQSLRTELSELRRLLSKRLEDVTSVILSEQNARALQSSAFGEKLEAYTASITQEQALLAKKLGAHVSHFSEEAGRVTGGLDTRLLELSAKVKAVEATVASVAERQREESSSFLEGWKSQVDHVVADQKKLGAVIEGVESDLSALQTLLVSMRDRSLAINASAGKMAAKAEATVSGMAHMHRDFAEQIHARLFETDQVVRDLELKVKNLTSQSVAPGRSWISSDAPLRPKRNSWRQ